jgi:putative methyltransferase (TIGR04325 family)
MGALKRIKRALFSPAAQEWIPPIGYRILRREFKKKNQCIGDFASYADASAACRSGYQDSTLIDIIHAKALVLKSQYERRGKPLEISDTDERLFAAIGLSGREKTVNVLDFGGGFGIHYFLAKNILGDAFKLNWCVVETEETVSRSSAFANEELRFAANVAGAKALLGHVDLAFSSGALQYLPEPLETLGEILDCGAPHFFLTRQGLTEDDRKVITVQQSLYSENGVLPGLPEGFANGTARYPLVLESRSRFLDVIGKKYQVRFHCREKENAYRVPGHQVHYYGIYASKADLPRDSAA